MMMVDDNGIISVQRTDIVVLAAPVSLECHPPYETLSKGALRIRKCCATYELVPTKQ